MKVGIVAMTDALSDHPQPVVSEAPRLRLSGPLVVSLA